MTDSIPITVLTGFLGAGKTTLLNRLLRQPELANTAVLINEFGEVGLDHLLVEAVQDEVSVLSGGCMCCTVRGDLVKALRTLFLRRVSGGVPAFTRVIIETTGLADPTPILHTLMSDPLIAVRYRFDGLVTLVNAANGAATLDEYPEAVRQVALADRIVLTKMDLASQAKVGELTQLLQKLNPGALTLTSCDGVIDPKLLLELAPSKSDPRTGTILDWLNEAAFARLPGHAAARQHADRIQSFCLSFDQPLPWQELATFLEMLVLTRGDCVLRMKGLLNLAGQERPVVIHGVQHVFHEPTLLKAWPAGDDRRSRLVFITRNLDRSVIEDGIAAFVQAAA